MPMVCLYYFDYIIVIKTIKVLNSVRTLDDDLIRLELYRPYQNQRFYDVP